jgi:hypothetical protein
MPFETLETITKANMPPRAKITYLRGVVKRGKDAGKHKDDAKPQLMVTIPTTICGTAKAKFFALLLGSGNDKGKIRIKGVKSEKEGVTPKELKNAFVFRFGYVPKLGDDIFDGGHRLVRKIGDDEFEIEIAAEWFTP